MSATTYSTSATVTQKNLELLAEVWELSSLQTRTTASLRTLCRECGIKHIDRTNAEGKPLGIRSATKDECIEMLELATRPFRKLAVAALPTDETEVKTLSYEDVFNLLMLTCDKAEDVERGERSEFIATAARATAYEVNDWIVKHFRDSSELSRHYARSNARSQYRARVEEFVKTRGAANPMIDRCFGVYSDALFALGVGDAELKKKANVATVENYIDNRTEVDVEPLHNWAVGVLSNLPQTSAGWKAVAVAVVIATGRRVCSEVLFSGSTFSEGTNDHEVIFSGVAKGKKLDLKEHSIPTTVPANLVLAGVEWLKDNKKREEVADRENEVLVTEARRKADKRFSKDLSVFWNANKETITGRTDDAVANIHCLRDLYTMHFTRGLDDYNRRIKTSELLCHSGDGKVAADSYTSKYKLA